MTSHPPAQTVESSGLFVQPQWWHKPLIWGVLLVVIYLLREFFLIGFLTFLICFGVRGLVGFLMRRISPSRENRRLQATLTLLVFVGFCVGLYGVGRHFVPPVIREGKALVAQLQNMGPEGLQNNLLANTVGAWQFQQKFGSPSDPRYQEEFEEFQQSDRNGQGLYQSFPELHARLQSEFEVNYERAQVKHLESDPKQGGLADDRFEKWLLRVRVPNLFQEKSDYYLSRWEFELLSKGKSDELAKLKKQPDFESVREQQIHQRILADLKSDPVMLTEYENQWAKAQSIQEWSEFRNSTEYQSEFKSFYDTRREENPAAVPMSYDFFGTLEAAYPEGKEEFLVAVKNHYQSENESLADQQHDFETATRQRLGQQWWGESHVADWVRDHAKNDGPKAIEALLGKLEAGLGGLMRVPIQVVTALVLAFFMLIEWHGIKEGMVNLRETRLRPIYDEIAPGIIALGKLIGKSFQGQVVIALFNAILTFIALWIIGVKYKFVLALLTFLFSFIPVIGVILSGVPMVAVAICQPGGSLIMAVQVLVAVAVIHMIEGMVLSPRIIGKIGHLNPVLVIVILLVAEHFFGMWGLILGVPVAIYLIRVVILRTPIPGIYEPESEPATV